MGGMEPEHDAADPVYIKCYFVQQVLCVYSNFTVSENQN